MKKAAMGFLTAYFLGSAICPVYAQQAVSNHCEFTDVTEVGAAELSTKPGEQCFQTIDGITVVMYRQSRVSVLKGPTYIMIMRNEVEDSKCTDAWGPTAPPNERFPPLGEKMYKVCFKNSKPVYVTGPVEKPIRISPTLISFSKKK